MPAFFIITVPANKIKNSDERHAFDAVARGGSSLHNAAPMLAGIGQEFMETGREWFQLARWKQPDDFLKRMMPGIKNPFDSDPAAEDHLAKANEVQSAIFKRMSPSRKLELAAAMNRQARDLMDSGLRQAHPEFTAEQRRREIAHRILHART